VFFNFKWITMKKESFKFQFCCCFQPSCPIHLGCVANHSAPTSTKAKETWIYIFISPPPPNKFSWLTN
jgi:hypothetical protein